MKFYCPHCNQKCETEADLSGQSIDCPTCGRTFVVPTAAGTPPTGSRPTVSRPVAPPRPGVPRPSVPRPSAQGSRPVATKKRGGAGKFFFVLLLIGGGAYAAYHYLGWPPQIPASWGMVTPAPAQTPAPSIQPEEAPAAPLPAAAVARSTPTPMPVPASAPEAPVPAKPSFAVAPTPEPKPITQSIQGAPPFAWQSDQGNGTFKNPILYADYCDPDIIRVGQDFFLVSSTFVNSPGINLLHSKDLVNWEKVANIASIVDGGEKFDMKGGTAYQEGFWAPSIRHHKGTFYVAIQPTFGPGRIYYATNPAGPWQYHQLDRGIYDPGLFIDSDGTGYIVCGHSPQSLMKLSPDFSKIVDEKKDFLNSEAEGCHMLKRGRYYYVFNARPGVWPFQLTCSRTTSLTNPRWEKRVALTAVTGGHQGAIVDLNDKDQWFGFVHHDSGAIGRMPQIGPVFWEKDWPIFGTPEKRDLIGEQYPKPIAGQPLAQVATSDDFQSDKLGLQWSWNHNPDNSRWSLSERPGFLRLHPTQAPGFWTARNTLTQKTQGPTSQGVVKLDLRGMKPGDVAGFGTLGKVNGQIFVTMDAKGKKTLGMRMIKDKVGSYEGASDVPLSGDTLYLRTDLDFVQNLAICSYSTDGASWTPLGGNFELMFGYGTTFQGQQFAIFCYNPQTPASPGYVDVDSFTFTGLDEKSDLIRTQRGRPHLNAARTTFVADNGQLLRGPYESTEWTTAAPFEEVARMKALGFNAVHLYGETFDPKYPEPGSRGVGLKVEEVDKFVKMTRDLGLYLVLTIGNGAANGNHNTQWVVEFWKFYAARYAHETHVLFEVQNEPVAWGPPYSNPKATPPGAVEMEVQAYKAIRAVAPDSPVLLFTYAVLGDQGGKEALKDIEAFNASVGESPAKVWSNAAVAFHGYAGHTKAPTAVADILAAGYPCFMTEFISRDWGGTDGQDVELTAELERLGVSWVNFLTIPPGGVSPLVTIDEVYKDRIDHSGLSWTPDFGIWPVARGVYGNGGQPRETPKTWEKDQLQGKFHLEFEDFDTGGPDVAYHDKNPQVNEGRAYRPDEGVDIVGISDGGAGFAVNAEAEEWLEYTIYVKEPGLYDLSLRYASTAPATLRLLLGGKEFKSLALENTGGRSSWKTLTQPVFLEYGRKVLRAEISAGACALNWLEFVPAKDGPLPSGTYKIVNRNSGLVMTNNVAKNIDKKKIAENEAANLAAGANEFAHKIGDNVIIQTPFSGENTQLWKLEHLSAGQYRISSLENKWFWNAGGSLKPMGLVWWGGENTGPLQRFVVRSSADGYYRVAAVEVGLDLDVQDALSAAGAPVVVGDGHFKGEPHAQWGILPSDATQIPTGLVAERGSGTQIDLRWNAVPGASGYILKRSETSGGPYQAARVPANQNRFLDRGALRDKSYFYVVSAVGRKGESLNSPEVSPGVLHAFLKFDETSGGVAADATGNKWEGTLVGSPQRTRGKIDGAIVFDGQDDYVTLPAGIVSGLKDFSILAWVNLDTLTPFARIFDFGTGIDNFMFLTGSDGPGNSLRFVIKHAASEQAITSSKPTPMGQWVHVAIVVKGGAGTLYLNGEEVGHNSEILLTPDSLGKTTQNYLGKSQFPDPLLKGKIDDFRIYASAISPGEIAIRAKAGPPTP